MKTTRRMIGLLLCILLAVGLTSAPAERDPWDCESCGRKGNTGNFCGSCGQPAPEGTPDPVQGPAWTVFYKVYYRDEAGTLLNTETMTLNGSGTVTYRIIADESLVPAGYVVTGEESAAVTVENGEVTPLRVTFVCRGTATEAPAAAEQPEGLLLRGVTGNSAVVTWTTVPGADGYRLELCEEGGGWQTAGTVKDPVARLEALSPNTEYTLRVTALTGQKETAPAEIRVRTLAAPVTAAGAYVTFGRYEQDNDTANGPEPIEWLVLEVDEKAGRALLLSRYALDALGYHESGSAVTWETCSLRAWLNGEFLDGAFTPEERRAIPETAVDNGSTQGYSEWAYGGSSTREKVFLLSCAEAERYLGVQHNSVAGSRNNLKARTSATAYAVSRGTYTSGSDFTADGKAACWWWLRSAGINRYNAASVITVGSLGSHSVSSVRGAVRPALWVDLNAAGL